LLGDDLHDASRRPRSAAATCLHLARISFHHPAKKRRVTLSSPAPTGFSAAVVGERDEERPLRAALTRRLPLITEHGTDAYRLLTGDVEDAKGLVAERFGEIGLLLVLDDRPALLEALPGIARWYRSILGLRAVYVKRFVKDRARVDAEVLAELHSPDPLPDQRVRRVQLRQHLRIDAKTGVGNAPAWLVRTCSTFLRTPAPSPWQPPQAEQTPL